MENKQVQQEFLQFVIAMFARMQSLEEMFIADKDRDEYEALVVHKILAMQKEMRENEGADILRKLFGGGL